MDARHANKGSAKAVLAKWNVKNVRQAASPVPRDFRTVQNVRRVTTNPHRGPLSVYPAVLEARGQRQDYTIA